MAEQPTLQTGRLRLRPFTLADAPEVARLAGDPAIAAMTLNIPHPYREEMASSWISTHREAFESGKRITFAVERREDRCLVGTVGLGFDDQNDRGEMGYWIGKPYWGNGYGTEAARALLGYGFEVRQLNRIFASHFAHNPASGRIMQKIGMRHEGNLRQHVKKWERYVDMVCYGILRAEYESDGAER